jgi:hypothetical protein
MLVNIPKMAAAQLEDQMQAAVVEEKTREPEPMPGTPPRRSQEILLITPRSQQKRRLQGFETGSEDVAETETWYDPPSADQPSADTSYEHGLGEMFLKMRPSYPMSFGGFSNAPSAIHSPAFSRLSRAAVRARPLEARHIIRLQAILRPPGEERGMFTRDQQIYGFKYNDWIHQNATMFPIESMKGGKKRTFGRYIKTNRDEKKKHFVFTVTRKASTVQISALLAYIEGNLPKLFSVTTYLQRKRWDKISGIQSPEDLREMLTQQLKAKKKVTVKITW